MGDFGIVSTSSYSSCGKRHIMGVPCLHPKVGAARIMNGLCDLQLLKFGHRLHRNHISRWMRRFEKTRKAGAAGREPISRSGGDGKLITKKISQFTKTHGVYLPASLVWYTSWRGGGTGLRTLIKNVIVRALCLQTRCMTHRISSATESTLYYRTSSPFVARFAYSLCSRRSTSCTRTSARFRQGRQVVEAPLLEC